MTNEGTPARPGHPGLLHRFDVVADLGGGALNALDLFAGVGWGLAARSLGIDDYGVDNMPEVQATRRAVGLHNYHTDVWTLGADAADFDGQIASPPCQTFSQSGKGAGRKALTNVLGAIEDRTYASLAHLRDLGQVVGDERTALVLTPLHYAMAYRPRWIAWEQVPTVLPVWLRSAEELSRAGYSTWVGHLHSEQYGVPQTRKRAFLLASLDREARPPEPTHSKYHPRSPSKLDPGVKPWASMADALGWALEPGEATVRGSLGKPKTHHADGTRAGGDHTYDPTLRPSYTVTSMEQALINVRWAVEPDGNDEWPGTRPSPTIVGTFAPDVVAAPGWRKPGDGPRQSQPGSVRVSVEEASILQGFPPGLPWQGSKSKQRLMIGNAVPPPLARAVLASLTKGAP